MSWQISYAVRFICCVVMTDYGYKYNNVVLSLLAVVGSSLWTILRGDAHLV